MAKVFIPQVGDKIELSSNWNCKIFNEKRNKSVFAALGVDVSNQENTNIDITFLKGTIFKVTRLYVRAPASSFDSITLSVVSSPIKKLAKAKFWVKIMDANNMEFDDKELTFDDFDSIYDLFMHLALKDGHSNADSIKTEDKQPYLQQIINHFSTPDNIISYNIILSKDEIISTYTFREENYYWRKNEIAYNEEVNKVRESLPENVKVNVTAYPVLQGALYKIDIVDEIKSVDQALGYYNQFDTSYNRKRRLGSYLSHDYLYYTNNIKKNKAFGLELALNQQVDFHVGNTVQKIKTLKEANKIMNSLMKKKI